MHECGTVLTGPVTLIAYRRIWRGTRMLHIAAPRILNYFENDISKWCYLEKVSGTRYRDTNIDGAKAHEHSVGISLVTVRTETPKLSVSLGERKAGRLAGSNQKLQNFGASRTGCTRNVITLLGERSINQRVMLSSRLNDTHEYYQKTSPAHFVCGQLSLRDGLMDGVNSYNSSFYAAMLSKIAFVQGAHSPFPRTKPSAPMLSQLQIKGTPSSVPVSRPRSIYNIGL